MEEAFGKGIAAAALLSNLLLRNCDNAGCAKGDLFNEALGADLEALYYVGGVVEIGLAHHAAASPSQTHVESTTEAAD